MELTVFLAWATVLFAVPLNVIAACFLLRMTHKAPHLRVLRERFITAVAITLVVLFFGVIFVNNDQTVPPIGVDATKVITRAAMLGLALVSAGGWLWIYRAHGRSKSGRSG